MCVDRRPRGSVSARDMTIRRAPCEALHRLIHSGEGLHFHGPLALRLCISHEATFAWSPPRMVAWSHGRHLAIWPSGHLAIWPSDHVACRPRSSYAFRGRKPRRPARGRACTARPDEPRVGVSATSVLCGGARSASDARSARDAGDEATRDRPRDREGRRRAGHAAVDPAPTAPRARPPPSPGSLSSPRRDVAPCGTCTPTRRTSAGRRGPRARVTMASWLDQCGGRGGCVGCRAWRSA